MLRKLFLALWVSVSIPLAAVAQAFVPLADVIERAAPTYPLIRCAAYYAAMAGWSGPQRLGQEVYDALVRRATTLSAVAAMMTSDEAGLAPDQATDLTGQAMLDIMSLYRARFEANFAARGEVFVGDALIESDGNICSAVAQLAEGALQEG